MSSKISPRREAANALCVGMKFRNWQASANSFMVSRGHENRTRHPAMKRLHPRIFRQLGPVPLLALGLATPQHSWPEIGAADGGDARPTLACTLTQPDSPDSPVSLSLLPERQGPVCGRVLYPALGCGGRLLCDSDENRSTRRLPGGGAAPGADRVAAGRRSRNVLYCCSLFYSLEGTLTLRLRR